MAKKKTIQPKLRFKDNDGNDFPDWEENILGNIATFSKGKNISKSDIVEDGNIECIRYGELYTEYGEVIKEIKSKTNLDSNHLVFSKHNDVIIPASGETQIDISTASCVLKDGVALGGDLNIIRSELNGVFLSYYLNNVKKLDIAKLAQGNAVVHLYANQLKTLTVAIPVRDEQNKIADFLSAIDDKINSLRRELEELKAYKKGVMQALFAAASDATERRLKIDALQDTKKHGFFIRFKDEYGKDYPDWEEVELGAIGLKFLNGGTPSTSLEAFWSGSIPWITGADFLDQKVGMIRRYITSEAVKESSTNVVEKGNLLIVTRTGVGKIAIAPFDVAISQDITGIYLNEKKVLTKYVFQYFIFKESDLRKNNQGTSISGIKREDLVKIKVAVPVLNEQQKIADFLFKIDQKIDHSSNQIQNTSQYKQALLQQFFN